MFKRYVCFLVSLMLLVSLTGCGSAVRPSLPFDTEEQTAQPDGTVITENSTYRMEWNAEEMSLSLVHKQTGVRWGTTPGDSLEPEYDELGMPIKKHPQVESALFVEYLDAATNVVNNVISYNGAVKNGRVVCETLSDGLLVKYYFDEVSIMIPVAYRLRETGLAMSVDTTQIQEEENHVVRLSLAPFWCAAANDTPDSYLLVPSGSGALIYPRSLSQSGQSYSSPVYGADASMELWDDPLEYKSVRLPVYGVKTGEKGTCAIIEQGAEAAYVEVKAGSTSLGYSSVYTTFQVRGYTENVSSLPNYVAQRDNVFAENMIQTSLQLGFYLLEGEDADYSAMAALYRSYLQETEGMTATAAADVPLALNVIGGTVIKKSFLGIPYKTLYPTTTLAQVEEILRDLTEATGVSPAVNLEGFGTTGLSTGRLAGGFALSSKLGSVSDLSSLADYCGTDIPLFMDFDLIGMSRSGNGFSPFFDSARSASSKVVYNYTFDIATRSRLKTVRFALLARNQLSDSVSTLLKKTASWELPGIGLSTLSHTAYSDYTDEYDTTYHAKGNMAADVVDSMQRLREAGKALLVSDANAYAAAHADLILRAPTRSSGEELFDADIPFYAMVFKGAVPLTCESLNQTPDPARQLLQAVESGCGLTYTVIGSYDVALIDASSSDFYNSLYEDIRPQMIAQMAQLSTYYRLIAGAQIQRHTIGDNGLRETVFDNGVSVYVNYTTEPLESPAGRVPAMSFLVRENGL